VLKNSAAPKNSEALKIGTSLKDSDVRKHSAAPKNGAQSAAFPVHISSCCFTLAPLFRFQEREEGSIPLSSIQKI
jgi:hypothetical protein